eukprot:9311483-Pyramimonas_sp.AAC.1
MSCNVSFEVFEIGHSLLADSTREGGVFACIQPSLCKSFSSIVHTPTVEGRILKSYLSRPNGDLCIMSVHTPNTSDLLAIYARALRDIIASPPSPTACTTVLIGDWNFALSADGRLRADGAGWSSGDDSHTKPFFRHSAQWTELHQSEDTRREVREGTMVHTARLDRAYCTLPPALLADLT